jgi:purine-binding chemotaxis protein CheW
MLLTACGVTVGLLASAAREVTHRTEVVRLPGADEFVCGVVNVRGSIVPLVDLGRLLGAGHAARDGWVVTLDLSGRRCALAVDALPVLRVADAPPGARPSCRAYFGHEVCVAGTAFPLLDVAALADDILLQ